MIKYTRPKPSPTTLPPINLAPDTTYDYINHNICNLNIITNYNDSSKNCQIYCNNNDSCKTYSINHSNNTCNLFNTNTSCLTNDNMDDIYLKKNIIITSLPIPIDNFPNKEYKFVNNRIICNDPLTIINSSPSDIVSCKINCNNLDKQCHSYSFNKDNICKLYNINVTNNSKLCKETNSRYYSLKS
jgi:hypothetical protein